MDDQKLDESVQARTKSIEVLQALLAKSPGDAEGLRFLAKSKKRLAYLYLTKLRDFPKAAQHLNTSLKIDQDRVKREPSNANAKLDLALDDAYLAGLMRRRCDLAAALGFQQAAVAARSEVLAADPRNQRTQYLLIGDQARLGGLLRDLRRAPEAKTAFERGFQIAREGDAELMKQAEAVAALEDLRKESTSPVQVVDEKLQQRR